MVNRFTHYKATKDLQELAKQAIVLSDSKQMTPERLLHYKAEACGYKLLYGTERITDQVLRSLTALGEEAKAVEKMIQMQNGEIVNYITGFPSENRPALHTATRDFFDHQKTTEKAKAASALSRKEIEKLQNFLEKIDRENNIHQLIVIGIGGSEQGPRANYYALQKYLIPKREVYFISNVDPDDAAAVLRRIDPTHTLVVTISKSGTTLETETNEKLVRHHFQKKGILTQDHFISITMPGTPMDNKKEYGEVFYIWDWIGGRLSTTSMVGGVVLGFACGFALFWEFLQGAHAMDQAALSPHLSENISLLSALIGIWNHNFLHYPTVAIIPYSQALQYYPAHLQQVDMESNGKSIDQQGEFVDFTTGPILWGSLGTNAQHSYFQLLHQGTASVPLLMIGFAKSQYGEDIEVQGTTSQQKLLSNLFAQSLALATGGPAENPNRFFPGNRPTTILLGEQLTPFTLGALLSFYEHRVAFQGFIWGINSFDQEGVQLGKVVANQFISAFGKKKEKQKEASSPFIEAYFTHLDDFQ